MPAHHSADHRSDASDQEECAGKHIAEHDTEEEWERNGRKVRRVHLFVGWDLILVNDHLAHSCQFTLTEVGGNCQLLINLALNGMHTQVVLL